MRPTKRILADLATKAGGFLGQPVIPTVEAGGLVVFRLADGGELYRSGLEELASRHPADVIAAIIWGRDEQ